MPFSQRAVRVAVLALLPLWTSPVQAETLDDKVFLNASSTGTSSGAGTEPSAVRKVELSVGSPPLRLSPSTFVVPTLFLRRTGLTLASGAVANLDLVRPGLVVSNRFSPRWGALIVQGLSWRTAGETAFSFGREVTTNGVYLLSFCPRGDDRYCWSGGLTLSSDIRRNAVLPAVGVTYENLARTFYLQVGFPYSNLLFRTLPDWEYGLTFELAGGYYAIDPRGPLAAERGAAFLRVRDLYAGPTVGYLVTRAMLLHVKGGIDFARSVDLLDRGAEPIAGTESSAPPTWFLKAGISFRFGAAGNAPRPPSERDEAETRNAAREAGIN